MRAHVAHADGGRRHEDLHPGVAGDLELVLAPHLEVVVGRHAALAVGAALVRGALVAVELAGGGAAADLAHEEGAAAHVAHAVRLVHLPVREVELRVLPAHEGVHPVLDRSRAVSQGGAADRLALAAALLVDVKRQVHRVLLLALGAPLPLYPVVGRHPLQALLLRGDGRVYVHPRAARAVVALVVGGGRVAVVAHLAVPLEMCVAVWAKGLVRGQRTEPEQAKDEARGRVVRGPVAWTMSAPWPP